MPMLLTSARRLVLAGGFAIAIAAAPAATLIAIPVAGADTSCPAGEIEDLFTDACVPEMAPNVPGGNWPTAGESSGAAAGGVNQLPEVNGVPCTGANTGQCIGLEENQPPMVEPHSSISSSP
jgi:hypothetical protein